MAYRDRSTSTKSDPFDYCILQVLVAKRGALTGAKDQVRLVTVDNHLDTLQFVKNNMDACIDNIVKLKQLEGRGKTPEQVVHRELLAEPGV